MSNQRVDTTANRLRIAMDMAGKKQVDLVRATGLDRGSISHYLKGRYEPKQDSIYKLAKALGVSEMWLWGYDIPMERPAEQVKADKLVDIVNTIQNNEQMYELYDVIKDFNEEGLKFLINIAKTSPDSFFLRSRDF